MELRADRDEMYRLMDEQAADRLLLILDLAVFIGTGLAAAHFGRRFAPVAIWLVTASAVRAVKARMAYRRKERFLMDISDCYIRLEDGALAVRQPAGDGAYEESCVETADIVRMVEEPEAGLISAGFYVYVRGETPPDPKSRFGETEIFFIRRLGYGAEDFRKLFWNLVQCLPAGTDVWQEREGSGEWPREAPSIGVRIATRLLLYFVPVLVYGAWLSLS